MKPRGPQRGATTGRRRAFGQHFLKDRGVCAKIADTTIELTRKNGSTALLEIGPGKGAITAPLMERLAGESLSRKVSHLRERSRAG
jgi:16S rRNA A1518/A1519 N6-dimethyltransferase RsmA/KsgA/DIM1 with predicted DNA glycosylase/AP lyase activity